MGLYTRLVAVASLVVTPYVTTAYHELLFTPQTFHAEARSVVIHAAVQDENGYLRTDLTRDDFEIRDEGVPVTMTSFTNQPQPLTLAIMLETSWSSSPRYSLIKKVGEELVQALGPGDRARIGTFSDEVAVSPLLTGDKSLLARVLGEELWPFAGIRLWGAIDAALDSLRGESGRRAVILVTGFPDRPLAASPDLSSAPAVRARALAEDVGIYAIGLASIIADLPRDLRSLSAESGANQFLLLEDANLARAAAEVMRELRHQYVLGFTPANLDGKEHRLQVSVRRPGHQVRARQSYIASAKRPIAPTPTPSAVAPPPSPDSASIRVSPAPMLTAFVSQTNGEPVPDLTADDFEVEIGGRSVRLSRAGAAQDAPLAIVAVVDVSVSLRLSLDRPGNLAPSLSAGVPAAAVLPGLSLRENELLDFVSVMASELREGDRMRVASVGRTPFLSAWVTAGGRREAMSIARRAFTGPDDARGGSTGIQWPVEQLGPSPIWDATDRAIASLEGEPGQRAILLLTDGAASGNRWSVAQVEQRALRAGVSIHVVGVKDRPFQVPQYSGVAVIDPRAALQALARSTGGSYVSMADRIDPGTHVRRIMRELAASYILTLSDDPSRFADPKAELGIRVRNPDAKVRVKARHCAADSCP